jgi:hypothetical protein
MQFYEQIPCSKASYAQQNRIRIELLLETDHEISSTKDTIYSQTTSFTVRQSFHMSKISSANNLPNPFAKPQKAIHQSACKPKSIEKKAEVTRKFKSGKTENTRGEACKYLQLMSRELIRPKDETIQSSSICRRKSKREPTQEELLLCAPIIAKRPFVFTKEMLDMVMNTIESNLRDAYVYKPQPKPPSIANNWIENSLEHRNSHVSEVSESSLSESDLSSPYCIFTKKYSEQK